MGDGGVVKTVREQILGRCGDNWEIGSEWIYIHFFLCLCGYHILHVCVGVDVL